MALERAGARVDRLADMGIRDLVRRRRRSAQPTPNANAPHAFQGLGQGWFDHAMTVPSQGSGSSAYQGIAAAGHFAQHACGICGKPSEDPIHFLPDEG
jgi:hypothetical protein